MRRAALAAMVALSCASKGGADSAADGPRVVIETAAGARHAVGVEVARTDPERARGLMHRTSLAEDRGMLFLFEDSALHAFWMKDTPLPLDMIFISEDRHVVGIVERAEPLSTTPRGVAARSRYVLEVNGGWARAHRVRPGDRVRFEDVPGL